MPWGAEEKCLTCATLTSLCQNDSHGSLQMGLAKVSQAEIRLQNGTGDENAQLLRVAVLKIVICLKSFLICLKFV